MRSLIVTDDRQLDRIERALAEFESQPLAAQSRKAALLHALRQEKAELLRYSPRLRAGARIVAARAATH